MDVVNTVNAIETNTVQYATPVLVGIIAAQQSGAAGASKKVAVVNAVLAAAQAGEQNSNQNVAAVSSMVDMFVSIFKQLNVFGFSSPAPAPAPAPIANSAPKLVPAAK